jgi:hypothetical protein
VRLKQRTLAITAAAVAVVVHRQLKPEPTGERDVRAKPQQVWPVDVLDAPPIQCLTWKQAMRMVRPSVNLCGAGDLEDPPTQAPRQRCGRPAMLGANRLENLPERFGVGV